MSKEKETKKTKRRGHPKARWKTKANAERILEDMRGGKSLRQICREKSLPLTKVNEWLNSEEYREQYADAQAARADYFFDEILNIADDCAANKDAVAKARLMIDTRKFAMARMSPKKYGDKVNVDVSGEVKETHNGKIDIAPDDSAIRGINAILGKVIRAGQNNSVEDTGEE